MGQGPFISPRPLTVTHVHGGSNREVSHLLLEWDEPSPRPSWWWIRDTSLMRVTDSCHLQDTDGHSPDHLGESEAFLLHTFSQVCNGDEGVVHLGMVSSKGGSHQSTQCHSFQSPQIFFLWIPFKAMFILHTASWARIQTSKPHLSTEGSTQTRKSKGLFHFFHLSLWPKPHSQAYLLHHPY